MFSIAKPFLLVCALVVGSGAFAQQRGSVACGSLENGYGPFDYTNAKHRRDDIPIVERHHFTANVESLRGGNHGDIMNDIDYTLRAVPNHHRALNAVSKFKLREPMSGKMSAECYFDRAIRFKPNDASVRLLYGLHLSRTNNQDEALEELRTAVTLDPESAEIHYNVGLLYTDMGNFKQANYHAAVAYRKRYPLPGLRNKLKRLGQWNPPTIQEMESVSRETAISQETNLASE